jgi:Tfp pilus assembly protein PilO
METGLDRERLEQYKATLEKYLNEPAKMRLAVVVALFVAGIMLIYMPLSDKLAQQRSLIATERSRAEAIELLESLQEQTDAYRSRIPENVDANNWAKYVLDLLRDRKLRLRDMSTKPRRKAGPYEAVVLCVEVEGPFNKIRDFIEDLESSDRLLRIDVVRLEKEKDTIIAKLTILGLMNKKNA